MSTTPVAPAGALAALAAVDAAAVRALALIDAGQIAPASTPATAAEPPPTVAPPQQVVAAAAQAAATEQTGLAPLFADLAAALKAPDLPPSVAAAAARVQVLATPLEPPPTAATLKAATSQSGLLLEATIAATGAPPPDDLKAALLALRQTLATAVEAAPTPPAAATLAPAAASQPATGGQNTSAQPLSPRAEAMLAHAEPPPPPPYRDAPLRAQPPAAARLPADATAATLVRALLEDVNGALARQVLFQLASLPNASPAVETAPHWMFELPFAAPQGASPTPFEISRDGGGQRTAGGEEGEPTWRARFSLDLGAAGPVHARVSLAAGRVRVGLWAEQAGTAAALDAGRGVLSAELAAQRFDPAVTVLPGQPAGVAADPGQFVDKAL
ncbi:MAG TPA: flagellar hook-length control protein FliK [Caulobacteraceae bacterium]|nr:flagellar hook-length control protein FliK [Caulobacteraceae bacterium]